MIQEQDLEEPKYDTKTGQFNTEDKKKTPKKFVIGGKMGYIQSINTLLNLLSKNEIQLLLEWFSNNTNGNNLLTSSFAELTVGMDKSSRSRLKAKLINNDIIQEHRKRLMLNPFIFKPTSTLHNYPHLTQKLWEYLFHNKDIGSDEVRFHEDDVYGFILK